MAITTIDNLTEIQSAGANDVLPISTANGVKKIKASALGGGGGDDFVVSFTITQDGSDMSVTADHTATEVYAAYQQGKNIKGVGELSDIGMTIIFYFSYIMTEDNEMTSVMFYAFGMEGGTLRIVGSSSGWEISTLS